MATEPESVAGRVVYRVQTARQPGAVAIIELEGEAVGRVLSQLTGRGGDDAGWPVGALRLCDFAGIDSGLAGRVSERVAQLMPHGGLRVLQRLEAWLAQHAVASADTDLRAAYPEAADALEAAVLHATARAASPAAIDRLVRQPALWAAAIAGGAEPVVDPAVQTVLNRLMDPPTVVVVGRPNAGKSTLLNRLTGRGSALVSDVPGTTRDWVGALVELTPAGGDPLRDAVAVRWLDTPGLRAVDEGAGDIERRAITAAQRLIAAADVLIVMRSPDVDWPDASVLPREPDLRVVNKCDLDNAGATDDGGLTISARDDVGLDRLAQAVLDCLGVLAVPDDALWDVLGGRGSA